MLTTSRSNSGASSEVSVKSRREHNLKSIYCSDKEENENKDINKENMNLKILFNVNTPLSIRIQNIVSKRCFASNTTEKDINLANKKSVYEVADEVPIYEVDTTEEEAEIQKMRNKSRLAVGHRNILYGKPPYEEGIEWYHHTVKYKKRMLGRYGFKGVDVPAGFAWPTPEEVEDMKEYERVAYPRSIREEWARIEEQNKKTAEAIKAREASISANLANMNKWIAELNARIAKKEADVIAAKELKVRLIEEVRYELGFNVPIHDDKFKEALARKEKAEKKKQKEVKKKMKEQKSLSKQITKSKQIDQNETMPSLDGKKGVD